MLEVPLTSRHNIYMSQLIGFELTSEEDEVVFVPLQHIVTVKDCKVESGMHTTIGLSNGTYLHVVENYDDIIDRWLEEPTNRVITVPHHPGVMDMSQ